MGENFIDTQSIVDICKERHIHGSIYFQLRYAPHILTLNLLYQILNLTIIQYIMLI